MRRRAKFVPGGVAKTFIPTKEPDLTGATDEWLARVVCFAFSVSPQPFVKMQNRATAETAQDTAEAEGLAPLKSWVKGLVDDVVAREFESSDLEFRWRDDPESDAATSAQVASDYVKAGIKSVNEVRAELGLDPVAGGELPMIETTQGPVPLGVPIAAAAAKAAVRKDFNPDEPRDDHGRWTSGGTDGLGTPAKQRSQSRTAGHRRVRPDEVVAGGPNKVTPEGQSSERLPGKDPLDPQGLNKPITDEEQQRIADTLTKIVNGDVSGLHSHSYQNLPHQITGAILPPSEAGYTAFDVAGSGAERGEGRILIDNKTDAMYYTNNHYMSFYPISLNPR